MALRVLIATAMFPTPENPAYGSFVKTQVEALRERGIDVDVLVLPRDGRALSRYARGVRELRKLARSGRYDIVHAHFSYVGVLARLQWRLPVVVTYHGDDLLATIVDQDGSHSLFSRAMVRLGMGLGRTVDAAIVQSQEMASKLGANERVRIISHEVDLELFSPCDRIDARRELGLDPDRSYLLFAAHPSVDVKRFSLAEAAWTRLRERGHDVELCIVHREPQSRLSLYMNACDALLFTSFQEGSPNVVKQALACNLPIVATDVGDIREMFGDAEDCLIAEPEPEAFAGLLADLVRSPRRTAGRERVSHLTKPFVAERIQGVYEDVLERRGSQARLGGAPSPAGGRN